MYECMCARGCGALGGNAVIEYRVMPQYTILYSHGLSEEHKQIKTGLSEQERKQFITASSFPDVTLSVVCVAPSGGPW